jgi:hypothetical protein
VGIYMFFFDICIIVDPFVSFLLVIVLLDLFQIKVFDYPLYIFKLFLLERQRWYKNGHTTCLEQSSSGTLIGKRLDSHILYKVFGVGNPMACT